MQAFWIDAGRFYRWVAMHGPFPFSQRAFCLCASTRGGVEVWLPRNKPCCKRTHKT